MTKCFDFRRFQDNHFFPWAEQFRSGDGPGEYSYRIGGPVSTYGTTDMLISRYIMNELDLSPEDKDAWAGVINSFQSTETGWYRKKYTFHHKEHTSAYATAALHLIDRQPLYPFSRAIDILKSRSSMERWFNGINWSVIWPGSHVVSGVPACLLMTGSVDDDFFDWYFERLDATADPSSGFWCRGLVHRLNIIGTPTKHEMGGAFHMYYIYEYRNRKWRYPEKIVDHTLRLQHANGLWDGDLTYCIDLDGIYCLTRSSRNAGGYRSDDVRNACSRYLATAEKILNDRDFFFRRYRNSHILTGALAAIAECRLWYPELVITSKPWRQSLDKACYI